MAKLKDNLYIDGVLGAKFFEPPANSVGNDALKPEDPIGTDKQIHKFRLSHHQRAADDHASEVVPLHTVIGDTGNVRGVRAWCITPPGGAATTTIDLKKNNVSVLSGGPITIDNTAVARTPIEGTINTSLDETEEDDVLELVIVATAGGGTLGKGLCVTTDLDELYQ